MFSDQFSIFYLFQICFLKCFRINRFKVIPINPEIERSWLYLFLPQNFVTSQLSCVGVSRTVDNLFRGNCSLYSFTDRFHYPFLTIKLQMGWTFIESDLNPCFQTFLFCQNSV